MSDLASSAQPVEARGERLLKRGRDGLRSSIAAFNKQYPFIKVSPADLSNPMTSEQTDGALFWKINEGRTPMPSFRPKLSSPEVWALVNYVRTLAPPKAAGLSIVHCFQICFHIDPSPSHPTYHGLGSVSFPTLEKV